MTLRGKMRAAASLPEIMRRTRTYSICLALWLGLVALAANAFEQQQLAADVLAAATAEIVLAQGGAVPAGFHVMPDGTVMAGSMAGSEAGNGHATPGGHTHKGYSDCAVCGAVAELAAFTLPVLLAVPPPGAEFNSFVLAALNGQFQAAPYPPYSSRAPPLLS